MSADPGAAPSEVGRAAARRTVFAKSLLAVVVLHAMFVGAIDAGRRPVEHVQRGAPTLWVRTIDAVSAPGASSADARPDVRPGPRLAAPRRRIAPPSAALDGQHQEPPERQARPHRPAPNLETYVDEPTAAQNEVLPDSASVVPGLPDGRATAQVSSHEAQVYATVIPAPTTLSFRMRRGSAVGNAELSWRILGERYEARLEASVAGAPLFKQFSQGSFDVAGLAPERFTDQRARRGARAITFQRDARTISFSAVPTALTLSLGVQDRLSWIVQLAAIASADPRHLAPGSTVSLELVGTRGELSVWHFVALGADSADGEPNLASAVRLQRLPGSTYDTEVELWLDRQPPHWPVRAIWRNGPADPGLELWRVDAVVAR